jgi:hypothetical protein
MGEEHEICLRVCDLFSCLECLTSFSFQSPAVLRATSVFLVWRAVGGSRYVVLPNKGLKRNSKLLFVMSVLRTGLLYS